MADRRVTQIVLEVDVDSTSGERQVSQLIVQVDILPAETRAILRPAVAIDSCMMVV